MMNNNNNYYYNYNDGACIRTMWTGEGLTAIRLSEQTRTNNHQKQFYVLNKKKVFCLR